MTAALINDLLVKLRDQLKITAIAVTHDLTSARKIAHRICLLHKGEIVGEETPDSLDHTENASIRQFIRGEAHGPMTDPEATV